MTLAVNIAQSGSNNVSFRNKLINGNMVIDQRNAGASVTPTGDLYTLDRWVFATNVSSKASVQQNAGSVTPPTGYKYYAGMTSLSAYTLGSNDVCSFRQKIEGFNVADLGWGTASAQTITLSFWVRSSLTGTFGGALNNSAENRSYPFTYTISTANTWEYETITIAGDQSGTWLTTNGTGISINFSIGTGSGLSGTAGAWAGATYISATGATSVVGTNGATFYITGVQLEAGTTASPFEYRQYGTELALCQRYFWEIGGTAVYEQIAMGLVDATTQVSCIISFPVAMRSAPSLGYSSSGAFQINDATTQVNATNATITQPGLQTAGIVVTASGLTVGNAARFFIGNSTSAYINFSSEL